jgi:hypothetical protein
VLELEKIQREKGLAGAPKTQRSLGAPDCPVRLAGFWSTGRSREFVGGVRLKITGLSGEPTVGCANLGKQSAPDTEQCMSGGTPDCPVRHLIEGKNCLPGLLSTAPSCLGAIKGTPRRMEEYTKHTLNVLRLPHSIFAHSIDILSDLSSVLVVNLLCFI